MRAFLFCTVAFCLAGCGAVESVAPSPKIATGEFETIGSIATSKLGLIDPSAKIEKSGGDYGWSEGSVWVEELNVVLFTDVPGNAIWTKIKGHGF